MIAKRNNRPDHTGPHEKEFRRNRQKIINQNEVCYLCGQPVDKTLKFPDPYSASVDHIVPLDKGGHPSAISNLALTHLRCNRLKSNNLLKKKENTTIKQKSTQLMAW